MLCGRGLSVMRIIIMDRNGTGHSGYDCGDNIRKLRSKREGSNYEWDSVQTRVRPVQLQCLWRLLEGVEWIETGRKTLHAMLRP